MKKLKIAARWLFGAFFIFAGANHFVNPGFYAPLMPPYLPWPDVLNVVSGVLEIAFGAGLLLPRYRWGSAIGIIALMLAFVPVHVYFIQVGSCIPDSLCVPPWVGWGRLVVVQPLLMLWAWWVR
ncbi:MAG TPA: DoxX family membrane protein [Saprospiraceae bacterium]|nr:DoxX family membrane protein [Saprospiraceae bacterium]HMP25566.1 DoxX family membrane protein [Saprospiraceae bacterium]